MRLGGTKEGVAGTSLPAEGCLGLPMTVGQEAMAEGRGQRCILFPRGQSMFVGLSHPEKPHLRGLTQDLRKRMWGTSRGMNGNKVCKRSPSTCTESPQSPHTGFSKDPPVHMKKNQHVNSCQAMAGGGGHLTPERTIPVLSKGSLFLVLPCSYTPARRAGKGQERTHLP